jgi:predicted RNA-binding Zn-ribbon protein involved in translation (DUF1610 family)
MSWNQRNQYQGGELIVDHRASPGLPEDVARFSGYDPRLVGSGKLYEQKTMTCSHCKCVVVVNPDRVRARENCPKCGNHYICDLCHADTQHPDYIHTPYEKLKDDTMEAGLKGMILGSPIELLRNSIKK